MTTEKPASAPAGEAYETDVIIVGAGPVGLFAVFELGLLDLKCHVVDVLDRPGGQCAELYPEKPIYDIPGLPIVTGQGLTDALMQQIAPFKPTFHLQQMAESLERLPDGNFKLRTELGTTITASVLVVAAGGGSFVPRKPKIEGSKRLKAQASIMLYARWSASAAATSSSPAAAIARSIGRFIFSRSPKARRSSTAATISAPRRTQWRRCASSSRKAKCAWRFPISKASPAPMVRSRAINCQTKEKGAYEIACNELLAFYGLTMKLGPIADFGLNLNENLIPVDTEKFQTSEPGIFAIGDINTYPGKLKLILSGFHEGALMAQAAFKIARPGERLVFLYTTFRPTCRRSWAFPRSF